MSGLIRKLLRSIKTSYRQFIALTAMVMAGAALYVAFNTSLTNLVLSRDNYYLEYGFADYYFDIIKAPQGLTRQIEALPGVAQVNGRIQKDINLIINNQRITGRLYSYAQKSEKGLYIIKGTSLRKEQSSITNGILIDPEFANGNQLGTEDKIKLIASGHEYVLPIMGIATCPEFMVPNKSVFDMFLRGESFGIIMASKEQAEQMFNMPGEINQLLVDFIPGTDTGELTKDIENILKPYGLLTSYPQQEHYSEKNMQFQVEALESASAFLPIIFFLMVICFLFILLRQQIKSQRLHIGILKALGYTNQSITLLFTGYALIVCISGSILGAVGGYYLAQLLLEQYARGFNLPYTIFEMNWGVVFKAFFYSTMAGVCSGIWASREITHISPAEAIRAEAPKIGSNTLLEQFTLLWNRISASWKMSFRSIARNQLRFVITALGIAASVILLIIAMFFNDSSDVLMSRYFQCENIYDYKIRFSKIVRNDEIEHWAKWEGVEAIEPVLEVPIKIASLLTPGEADQAEDDILVGVSSQTRLKSAYNVNRERLNIPEEGILLNKQIAQKLHVQTGDMVSIQTNWGTGPSFSSDLMIREITDQDIGGSSFASLNQVDRLLHEKGVSNAVLIKMDKSYEPSMIKQFNNIPEVDYIVDKKKQAYRAQKSLGNMIYFTMIATIAAVILGFAVVYNISIMNFNERQKELSSLKVIGFTNHKISRLMFNELILALIPGIIIGLLGGKYIGAKYIENMATDFIAYPVIIYPSTYVVAVVLTMAFVFLGHVLAMRRSRNLDIVEALKERN